MTCAKAGGASDAEIDVLRYYQLTFDGTKISPDLKTLHCGADSKVLGFVTNFSAAQLLEGCYFSDEGDDQKLFDLSVASDLVVVLSHPLVLSSKFALPVHRKLTVGETSYTIAVMVHESTSNCQARGQIVAGVCADGGSWNTKYFSTNEETSWANIYQHRLRRSQSWRDGRTG